MKNPMKEYFLELVRIVLKLVKKEEFIMMYPFMTLNDDTEIVHS